MISLFAHFVVDVKEIEIQKLAPHTELYSKCFIMTLR